jgi:hypothetical protein
VAVALAVYSKQIAIFIVPVMIVHYMIFRRPSGLIRSIKNSPGKFLSLRMISVYTVVVLIFMVLAAITFKFSRENIAWIMQRSLSDRIAPSNLFYYIRVVYREYLTLPVILLSLVSIVITLRSKEGRGLLYLLWIVICYLFFTALGTQNHRFALGMIPPFCLFAASLAETRSRKWKIATLSIVSLAVIYQFAVALDINLETGSGYEDAARYVMDDDREGNIMYGGVVDTGYFVFFVRKYDPARRAVVLRADKIYATSAMREIVEEHISNRNEIYSVLNKFGVRYVVIEDTRARSNVLEWLREEVRSNQFIRRKVMPIMSSDRRINNVSLAVYEYRNYSPPAEDAVIDMNIVLMNERIKVPIYDLMRHRAATDG